MDNIPQPPINNVPVPPTHKSMKWPVILGVTVVIVVAIASARVWVFVTDKGADKNTKDISSENMGASSAQNIQQPSISPDTTMGASSTKRLAEIEARLKEIDTKQAPLLIAMSKKDVSWDELDSLKKQLDSLSTESRNLQTEYNRIQIDVTKQGFGTSSSSQISNIYSKYCNSAPIITYKNTDYSTDFITTLGKTSIDDLANSLVSNKYTDPQIPEALYYVGFKLTQAGNIDDSLKFYKCAAEKYYDMQAMYRMASLYDKGTDSLKTQLPDAVINNPVSIDYKQAYYWISSLIYAGTVEKTSLLDTSTTRGWNSIALLDDLQMTGKVSDSDMVSIENDVRTFISKRYPQILNSNARVIKHKL